MSDNLLHLPTGPEPPTIVNAIIEIPSGCSNKYEYDKTLNVFKLDRTLFSPVHYPGAYGFIPGTHAEDGDPLDVLAHKIKERVAAVDLRRREFRGRVALARQPRGAS